ncbi:hypothetical protein ACWCPD_15945 [Streptomyces sp. NPDC001935]
MSVLVAVGSAFAVLAVAGRLTGRLSSHQFYALTAAELGLYAISDIRRGDYLMALWNSAGCAYLAWHWWNGGGGDDTKRRLREWGRKFQGTRRTAPSAA